MSKVYLVSVGPGDKELLTLKAYNILNKTDVIAYPVAKRNVALDIIDGTINLNEHELLPLTFTMSKDLEEREKSYLENAKKIREYILKGKDVSLITLGDVSIYSTAVYLKPYFDSWGIECVMVPGVTSFSAISSLLCIPLTELDEMLHIVPARANVRDALLMKGTKVIMKAGKDTKNVISLLKEMNLLDKAYLVSDCGMESEKVYKDLLNVEDTSYFSTFIVKE